MLSTFASDERSEVCRARYACHAPPKRSALQPHVCSCIPQGMSSPRLSCPLVLFLCVGDKQLRTCFAPLKEDRFVGDRSTRRHSPYSHSHAPFPGSCCQTVSESPFSSSQPKPVPANRTLYTPKEKANRGNNRRRGMRPIQVLLRLSSLLSLDGFPARAMGGPGLRFRFRRVRCRHPRARNGIDGIGGRPGPGVFCTEPEALPLRV